MPPEDDDSQSRQWGTIFMQGGEQSLGGVERGRSANWTPEDEAAYLARVKEKAIAKAARIIEAAKAEAGDIRRQAQEEGYNAGLENAREELEAFRSGMADSVAAVLSAIEGQCAHIFQQWREDLTALVRLAVEKGTGIALSENRAAMLQSLLVESIGLLEHRRELVIRVNPEDEPVIADIVGLTQEKYPDVKAWRVKPDSSITPGGMVVESQSSLAEGRMESRLAAVGAVLAHLSLPAE